MTPVVELASCGHEPEQVDALVDGEVRTFVIDGPCSACWLDEDDDYRRGQDR